MGRNCREEYHSLLKIFGRSPLFLYSSIFVAGIIFAGIFPSGTNYSILFSSTTLIILIVLYYFSFIESMAVRGTKDFSQFLKISLIFSFFALGILSISLNGYYNNIRRNSRIPSLKPYLDTCLISETPKPTGKFMKFPAKSAKYNESILIYLKNDIYSSDYEIGDSLIVSIKSIPLEDKKSKNNFDYTRYLKEKGIYSMAFISGENVIVKKSSDPDIRDRILRLRERSISGLNAKINNPEIHATLVALTTGVKSYLSDDIRKSFSKSGTMHLLAVSGLHVGYIYSVLLLITSIFGNFRFSVFMRSILIIILLWGYALFTGMAPSIERAVLMATIYQIGTIFGKRKNSLNSLSLSALIICIFDPGAVFDIGFQLSYAATLSIILINPFINRLYQTKNPIMKYVWTTVSISTSCQIGTSILTIYYFKFIPVYFMISNLLAIPLSSIIISTTMILVIAGDSGISVLLVPLLKFLVWMLNESMAIISTLPYPVIEF
jgi:competence protein ComEC